MPPAAEKVGSPRAVRLVLQYHRTPRHNEAGMKIIQKWQSRHPNSQAVISLALARYKFATPEIRALMRCVLGHAISGRTIKRLAKDSGHRLKRGRPRTTPKIHKGDLSALVELTSHGPDGFNGNALQLFHQVQGQFGLTPRQYLKWVAKYFRRGKCMMRRCLLCEALFASMDVGERHCKTCQGSRRRLLNEDHRSAFV